MIQRAAALMAIFGLFLVGILVGALATHLFYADRLARPGHPGPMGERRFIDHLEDRLDLTEDQRSRIDAILEESHSASSEIREEVRPRIHEQMERTRARINEVLTPEQREQMERLERRHRRRADRFFLGRGHRPPPPHR